MQSQDDLTINIRGKLRSFSTPWVMGIVNVTPDSFYAASRTASVDEIRRRVSMMVEQGADAIDVGGYSSRPGADEVTPEEEITRLGKALEVIRKDFPTMIVSVDTFRGSVASRCIRDYDIDIINDIGGGTLSDDIMQVAADSHKAYVLMHMRGTPSTMQSLTDYNDVTAETLTDLAIKADRLHQMGVADVILDPGFGFAKTLGQNYTLMAQLEEFKKTGMPLLVGISHKSMIYNALNITANEALNGTTILHTIALMKGADILRVHDVREAVEAVKLTQLIKQQTSAL
jgi:dihydropteroate synthase